MGNIRWAIFQLMSPCFLRINGEYSVFHCLALKYRLRSKIFFPVSYGWYGSLLIFKKLSIKSTGCIGQDVSRSIFWLRVLYDDTWLQVRSCQLVGENESVLNPERSMTCRRVQPVCEESKKWIQKSTTRRIPRWSLSQVLTPPNRT